MSPTCAQRLTASEVWHVVAVPAFYPSRLCSTPYGIRGLAPTPGLVQMCQRPCAQRLTASEVWHYLTATARASWPIVLNALRHQRFGTFRADNNGIALEVLNALRHQRFGTFQQEQAPHRVGECSTPYGIRGLAPLTAQQAQALQRCSTPYGIRGLALSGCQHFGND